MTHATGCRNASCQGCMRAGENGAPGSPSEVVAELEANAIRVAEIIANSRRLQRDNDRLRQLVEELRGRR